MLFLLSVHTPPTPHTHTEEQDALIVACEDDRYVVVAGTFEKLVEQLAGDEKPGKYTHQLRIVI